MLFSKKWEAEVFYQKLQERFEKYGLELAMKKTKILEFERFAKQNRKDEEKGNQTPLPLTSLTSHFIAGWMERKAFSVSSKNC